MSTESGRDEEVKEDGEVVERLHLHQLHIQEDSHQGVLNHCLEWGVDETKGEIYFVKSKLFAALFFCSCLEIFQGGC